MNLNESQVEEETDAARKEKERKETRQIQVSNSRKRYAELLGSTSDFIVAH